MVQSASAIKTAVSFFLIIVVGALAAALLGGLFAAFIAVVSPEFVSDLFDRGGTAGIMRYSFVVGMLWGLFIGAAAAGFACFLAAIIKILSIRLDYKRSNSTS